jgi:hypothetical protein
MSKANQQVILCFIVTTAQNILGAHKITCVTEEPQVETLQCKKSEQKPS